MGETIKKPASGVPVKGWSKVSVGIKQLISFNCFVKKYIN